MLKTRARMDLSMTFTKAQYKHLSRGLIPQQMEDKWFVFMESEWLYFHRSWTGKCMYMARIVPAGDGYELVEAWTASIHYEPMPFIDGSELRWHIERLLGLPLPCEYTDEEMERIASKIIEGFHE